ncbi:MAG: hypothetical protein ACRCXB_25250 [Aeromonadaceae bacterium]
MNDQPRYATSIAALKMLNQSAALDMTPDDYEFFTGDRIWLATDRSRARRCVEAAVYGTLDFCGYPRFPAPVEFISAAIAHFVHPANIQTACLIMEGAEFSENIINGVERTCTASEIFAHTLLVRSNNIDLVRTAENQANVLLKGGLL